MMEVIKAIFDNIIIISNKQDFQKLSIYLLLDEFSILIIFYQVQSHCRRDLNFHQIFLPQYNHLSSQIITHLYQ